MNQQSYLRTRNKVKKKVKWSGVGKEDSTKGNFCCHWDSLQEPRIYVPRLEQPMSQTSQAT